MIHRTRFLLVLAALAGACLVLAAPAVAITSITVTEPNQPSYFTDATLPIAWHTDVTVSAGQFAIWLTSPTTQPLCLAVVRADAGSLQYRHDVTLDYPPAGTNYKVRIGYRQNTKAAYSLYGYSAAFALQPRVTEFPFETLTNAPWRDSVVKGLGHDFRFWVMHPDPQAVVTSASVVFVNARTGAFVRSVPVTGISSYVIESDWSGSGEMVAPNVFHWTSCSLDLGTYEWHVLVTVGGKQNTMWDDATLAVIRR